MEKYELVYKIEKNKNPLRLIGKEFFQRNKGFGNFIYQNKRYKLQDTIDITNFTETEIKFDLIFYKIIYDKSGMFKDCTSLLKCLIPDEQNKISYSKIINIPEEEGNLFDIYDNTNYSENPLYKTLTNMDSISISSISENSQLDSNSTFMKNYNNLNFISNKESKSFILTGMFHNCSSLISLPEISKWNIDKVSNLSGVFYNCSSLISLPDISNWNTDDVVYMEAIFYNCSSLISLPDISKWNISNVKDMSELFANCSSLKSLPDISKWNIKSIVNISKLFYNCSSIQRLPDISLWKTNINFDYIKWEKSHFVCHDIAPNRRDYYSNDIRDISGLFENCLSLKSLPDISNWNIKYVINISRLFYNCSSLISLPCISIWKTFHVEDISELFYNCSSLISVPNISIWNTYNLKKMNGLFYNCLSLSSLPNISRWHIKNVENIDNLFYNCSSLSSLPDISKWKTKKMINMNGVFTKCINLQSLPNISKWDLNNIKNMNNIFSDCLLLNYPLPDSIK